MKSIPLRFLALAGAAALLSACATSTRVARIDPNQQVDISGNWNDADSKLVADEMIRDALTTPWASRFMQSNQGKTPTVVIGQVANRSSEHINTQVFVQDMVNAFVRSGGVNVVSSGDQRSQTRAEREDQQQHASADTRARLAAEHGANFILVGTVNTINDREGRVEVKYYQVDLNLTNVETNQLVWTGQKKIKKFVQRPRYRP